MRAPLVVVVALSFVPLYFQTSTARAQDVSDEPLTPSAVSESDMEIRGRYSRQWKRDDGTLVLMVQGAFRLDFAGRELSADNAVAWITPRKSPLDGRKYYELSVYLAGKAQVREPAGTIVEDQVLLVSNLRTYGRIVKYDDAHAPESQESTDLYRRATEDRALIEGLLADPDRPVQEVHRPVELERPRPRPRQVRYVLPSGTEPAELADGTPIQIATGRVYFSQTGGPDSAVLEIQADNAVIFPASRSAASMLGDEPTSQPATRPTTGRTKREGAADVLEGAKLDSPQEAAGFLRGVYLEGDVILSLGTRTVRASRLYYDFEQQRALMLDAVLRAELPERNIPLYVRAEEIRQLSAREFSATRARVSTSEFFTPHYHIGAEKVVIYDRSSRDTAGSVVGPISGTVEIRDSTLNLENVPIAYWPYSRGDLEASETLLRRFRTGYSDDFGVTVETAWYLFNLLGVEAPPGFDATLRLDEYSKRGPGIGTDIKWERDDSFGYFKGYYINDGGEDDFGPLRDNTPESANRGRALLRHRQYLANDWEATLELSYVSDPGFMEEYERGEWFNEKQQEQAIYLKRAKDVEAITLLANWRSLDFITQTEHLPELAYRRIGDVLDPFVFYHESRVGVVRYRTDDRRFFDRRWWDNQGLTDSTFRADVREEAELPLKLPGFNVVPFSTVRGSFWDGQPLDEGSLWRGLGVYGVRGSGWLSKVYDDAQSELFDIDRIRHIVQPHAAGWFGHSNTRSELITPFDQGIETIDAIYGAVAGVRQIWQTKRGPAGSKRTSDVFTLNLEAGVFGGGEDVPREDQSNGYANPFRPEDSRARNYAAADFIWRISDTTALLYDANVDLDDGSLDRQNVSLAIERSPRLSYLVGYRHAGDIDLDLIGGGYNYRISEKHITAVRVWYDTDRGRLGELELTYVRKLPRWYLGVTFQIDNVFDDITVLVSLWPEGVPEWALGSKRYTGLAESTAIRP